MLILSMCEKQISSSGIPGYGPYPTRLLGSRRFPTT